MEAKEKSKELVNKYLQIYDGRVPQGKKCALSCVDEILKNTLQVPQVLDYWQEVKQEIENIKYG